MHYPFTLTLPALRASLPSPIGRGKGPAPRSGVGRVRV